MIATRSLPAALCLLGAAGACPAFAPAPPYREPPPPKVSAIARQIQGTWELDNPAFRLMAVPRRTFVRIDNGTWTYLHELNGRRRTGVAYPIRLDPSRSPAALDVLPKEEGLGKVLVVMMRGIVKVEGDTLTFSYTHGRAGGERPTFFGTPNQPAEAVGGVSVQTLVFKKVK